MTIDISNNDPRISYTVAAGVTQTSFAVPFEFFDDSDVNVYVNEVLKTITTDYTISGGDGSTGTVTISVTGPATVTLTRDITIERVTDFPTGIDINRAALNTQLDTLTAIAADLKDEITRNIRVSDADTATNLTLPSASNRADKVLSFDTEGNVQTQNASDLFSGSILGANYVNNTATGDGSTVAFGVSVAPGSKNNIQIYIDGVYQNKATFSISGSTVTFSEAPPLNAAIEFVIGSAVTSISGDADGITYTQGSTGSQQRTVENKLQEFVSVKDFGAVGDGVADDTAAIQAALDAADCIYFPQGTYAVSSTVNIPANKTLKGNRASINALVGLQAAAARSYIFEITGNGVVFDTIDIEIDYTLFPDNPLDQAKVGAIHGDGRTNFVMKDCFIAGGANKYQASGFLQTPLIWFENSSYIRFENCFVRGDYTSSWVGSAAASEILYLEDCNDCTIQGGIYRGSFYSCIAVGGVSARILIDGVQADTSIGSVISFNCTDSTVSNSNIGLSRDQTGVAVGHPTDNCSRSKVIGCRIYDCGRSGITFGYTDFVCANNIITDCDQLSPTDLYAAGIAVGDSQNPTTSRFRGVIQGNQVRGCYNGIVVSDSSVAGVDGGDYTITGNVVTDNTATGIYSQAPQSVIVGNETKDNGGNGISLSTSRADRSLVSSNISVDNGGSGIACNQPSDQILIYGNVSAGNTLADTVIAAGGTIDSTVQTMRFSGRGTSLTTGDILFALEGINTDTSTGAAGSSGGIFHEIANTFGTESQTRLENFYVTGGSHTMIDVLKTSPAGLAIRSFWNPSNEYYLWVDTTGDLRIKNGVPTSATDGTVVGTQS